MSVVIQGFCRIPSVSLCVCRILKVFCPTHRVSLCVCLITKVFVTYIVCFLRLSYLYGFVVSLSGLCAFVLSLRWFVVCVFCLVVSLV